MNMLAGLPIPRTSSLLGPGTISEKALSAYGPSMAKAGSTCRGTMALGAGGL